MLPIIAYGNPVLKKKCIEIDPSEKKEMDALIEEMFETMYNANGVGLAAPQVGKSIRLFLVDSAQVTEKDEESTEEGIRQVFINATILEESGEEWDFEEGCLSIPNIREDISRLDKIRIGYYDETFEYHEKEFDGFTARVIQHEYDHIEGVLFTDKLKPLKKRLLKNRLSDIAKGKVKVAYKMKFPLK